MGDAMGFRSLPSRMDVHRVFVLSLLILAVGMDFSEAKGTPKNSSEEIQAATDVEWATSRARDRAVGRHWRRCHVAYVKEIKVQFLEFINLAPLVFHIIFLFVPFECERRSGTDQHGFERSLGAPINTAAQNCGEIRARSF